MEYKFDDGLRAHRRLMKAYTSLLSSESYKSVSVKKLTDTAEMSRAAFYLHFDSMEDFSYQCSQYLIRKISKQMIHWLSQGPGMIEYTCKKRNLLIDETDRELFRQYVRQEIYFPGYSSFDTLSGMYYEFVAERFSVSVEECKNNSNLNFFIRAFSASIMDSIADYDSKKMCRDMHYVFMIWNKLLPEYQLK